METSSTSREYYCDTKNNNNCRLVFFVNSRSGGSTRDAVASLLSRIERRRKTRGDCSSIVLDDYDGNETALKEKVRFELTTTGGRKTTTTSRRRRLLLLWCEQSRGGDDGVVDVFFAERRARGGRGKHHHRFWKKKMKKKKKL